MAQPKTIFGHGSRCPQTSPGGQACEGNFWHRLAPRRGEKLETMCFMGTLEGRHKLVCSSEWEALIKMNNDEEHASLYD